MYVCVFVSHSDIVELKMEVTCKCSHFGSEPCSREHAPKQPTSPSLSRTIAFASLLSRRRSTAAAVATRISASSCRPRVLLLLLLVVILITLAGPTLTTAATALLISTTNAGTNGAVIVIVIVMVMVAVSCAAAAVAPTEVRHQGQVIGRAERIWTAVEFRFFEGV